MASSPSPGTPQASDRGPKPGIRRAFTLPTNFTNTPRSLEPIDSSRSDEVEILFSIDYGKIVSFAPLRAPTLAISDHGRRGSDVEITKDTGTLPWASRTERMLASGPIQIYRMHGVAFLASGKILHAIMPKSQCWCVDKETKFVLRIRENNFYRIELPNNSDRDREVADELKGVLTKVLQYEKTKCPFKRCFTVELPEPPTTPVKMIPWRRRESSGFSVSEDSKTDKGKTLPDEAAKLGSDLVSQDSEGGNAESLSKRIDVPAVNPQAKPIPLDTPSFDPFTTPTRSKLFSQTRSVTAPIALMADRSLLPASNDVQNADTFHQSAMRAGEGSLSSPDTFYSFHSPVSPFPPSPPQSSSSSHSLRDFQDHTELEPSQQRQESKDLVELRGNDLAASAADAPTSSFDEIVDPTPSTPPSHLNSTSNNDYEEETEDDDQLSWLVDEPTQNPTEEIVVPKKRQVAMDNEPPSTPRASSTRILPSTPRSGHHLATAIVQHTCSLMLMTPAQLFSRMLTIARMIAAGARRGIIIGIGEGGEKIPCHWETSESEAASGDDADEDDDSDEDDFGFSLGHGSRSNSSVRRREIGGSWEVE